MGKLSYLCTLGVYQITKKLSNMPTQKILFMKWVFYIPTLFEVLVYYEMSPHHTLLNTPAASNLRSLISRILRYFQRAMTSFCLNVPTFENFRGQKIFKYHPMFQKSAKYSREKNLIQIWILNWVGLDLKISKRRRIRSSRCMVSCMQLSTAIIKKGKVHKEHILMDILPCVLMQEIKISKKNSNKKYRSSM